MANLNEQVQAQKKEIESLKQTVSEMQRAKGVSFIKSMEQRLKPVKYESDETATDANIDRQIDTSGATAQVLDYPTGFVTIETENGDFNIPYYSTI